MTLEVSSNCHWWKLKSVILFCSPFRPHSCSRALSHSLSIVQSVALVSVCLCLLVASGLLLPKKKHNRSKKIYAKYGWHLNCVRLYYCIPTPFKIVSISLFSSNWIQYRWQLYRWLAKRHGTSLTMSKYVEMKQTDDRITPTFYTHSRRVPRIYWSCSIFAVLFHCCCYFFFFSSSSSAHWRACCCVQKYELNFNDTTVIQCVSHTRSVFARISSSTQCSNCRNKFEFYWHAPYTHARNTIFNIHST